MRLKTPLFLALVIGPLLAIIFVIWPEFEKISPKREVLRLKEELVASIRQKNSNIASLNKALDDPQNSADKNFVLNYIPLDKKEELIFNSISDIAAAEGVKVAVSNVSLQLAKEEVQPVAEAPMVPEFPIAGPADPMAAAIQPVSVLPAVKTIRADISIVGNYEGQKGFIAKLYALDMLKNIASFNLSVQNSEGAAKDVLNGMISAEFSFIPEAKIGKDYNNPIFSLAGFNFEAVGKLKALLSQKAAEVAVEGVGRTNPFLP